MAISLLLSDARSRASGRPLLAQVARRAAPARLADRRGVHWRWLEQRAVRDTGDGLEPEQLGAVFECFYRTDESRSRDTGGTGLAIVSALVVAHGGTVMTNNAGHGTGCTFTIRLPLA